MALLSAACVLPMAIALVIGVARLLGAMQDDDGAAVLDRVALALGIVWAIDLVCLVISMAVNALGPPGDHTH
jgi:hypothetical protein